MKRRAGHAKRDENVYSMLVTPGTTNQELRRVERCLVDKSAGEIPRQKCSSELAPGTFGIVVFEIGINYGNERLVGSGHHLG